MNKILCGDAAEALKTLPPESVDMCVTSPPYYGLRDYGEIGQIGIEQTPDEYIARLVKVFDEVYRVLKKDGRPFKRHAGLSLRVRNERNKKDKKII